VTQPSIEMGSPYTNPPIHEANMLNF